ncbi:helix-turn-helix domain-containing protein [Clostridium sp.]|uniref:helix-turn-helix domain-containing protein n=1 Tax=Clostridium sp. TaxID=1506 RepID=UPI002FDE4E35
MADKLVQFKGTVYEDGYGIVAKRVMRDNEISIGAKCLYAYLCTFIDTKAGNTNSFPGRNKICFDLKISKDTFGKYRKELEAKGYLIVTQKKEDKSKKFAHNVYSIETIPCPKKPDTEEPDTEKPYPENLDTKSTNIKNTNNKSTSNKYSTQFLEWYSLYPNPWNKEQSFKNFKHMLKKDTFENLMVATKNYIAVLQRRGNSDKQYITRSTNFIGQKKEYLGYLEMDLQENVKGDDKVGAAIEALEKLEL